MFFRVISAGRQRWKRCISVPYLGSGKPLLLTVPWPRPVTGPSEWLGGWETQGSTVVLVFAAPPALLVLSYSFSVQEVC